MYKKFKFRFYISVLLIFTIFSSICLQGKTTTGFNETANVTDSVNVILDNTNYNVLPKHFRKTSNLKILDNKNLNLNGLDKLNISGSQQFSGLNLSLLLNAIDTSLPIIDVDLRQESHGFINGLPVSWKNSNNSANKGLSRDQVILKENEDLKSIKLNSPLTFYNHPKMTITPTEVKNESTLAKDNSISYIRVPVTDGNLPTADMVDYFIKSVKDSPKNAWFHFHCKEGVGRTSTFMIMYDMMKNYKVATAKEIIDRQLLLVDFTPKDIQDLTVTNRMAFLQSFYEYCQKNGDDFKTTYSDFIRLQSTNSNRFLPVAINSIKQANTSKYYIKNNVIPNFLYVISQDKISPAERTMIATLQGIVNNKSSSQIYILNSSQPDYQLWLDDLINNYKIEYKLISDPWQLLDIFKNYVDGYTLYNNKTLKDPSINNACTAASINNSIAIDESIQDKVNSHGITKIKADCRNTDENWAYKNLWNSGLNHSLVIQLSPDKDSALRDYAIMTKSLIFYEDNANNISLRDEIFSSMEHDSICLGWGPDEFVNVSTASKHGISMVAADWSYNLSVLSAFPSYTIVQNDSSNNISKSKENFHYVTFIMSDGDNQQWYLGNNYSSAKWYGYSYRGGFNLGWSISPSLYYLAPTVFNKYYKNASNKNFNDYFVVSPSGNGYMYPSKFDSNSLNSYLGNLNSYMETVNQKYVSIIDDSSFYNNALWNKFTEKNNIDGLFYLDYHRHDNYHGKILWSNNKPIVSCRDLLWEGLEGNDELIKNINTRVASGEIDCSNPNSYTFVYVHVWSKNMNDVNYVINKLNENPKIKVVTPKTFMECLQNNVQH